MVIISFEEGTSFSPELQHFRQQTELYQFDTLLHQRTEMKKVQLLPEGKSRKEKGKREELNEVSIAILLNPIP